MVVVLKIWLNLVFDFEVLIFLIEKIVVSFVFCFLSEFSRECLFLMSDGEERV